MSNSNNNSDFSNKKSPDILIDNNNNLNEQLLEGGDKSHLGYKDDNFSSNQQTIKGWKEMKKEDGFFKIRKFLFGAPRYIRDRKINNEKYDKLTNEGFVQIRSEDIKAGDIIQIQKGQRVPVDMVVLYTDDPSGLVFIKTDQLDGETDWKLRKSVQLTQNLLQQQDHKHKKIPNEDKLLTGQTLPIQQFINDVDIDQPSPSISPMNKRQNQQRRQMMTPEERKAKKKRSIKKSMLQYAITDEDKQKLLTDDIYIKVQPPIVNIYEFEGKLISKKAASGNKLKEPLNLDNTLWANVSLASGQALGIVVYTGKETRFDMNSKDPRSKIGKTDYQIGFLCKLLFGMLLFMTQTIMIIRPATPFSIYWISDFVRYMILLSYLIPMSMKVNLDIAKLWYCLLINKDKKIEGTVARNSNIPEELGRIQYLLTDKTGTLTQNDMVFQKLYLKDRVYTSSEEDQELIRQQLDQLFEQNSQPFPQLLKDYYKKNYLPQKQKKKSSSSIENSQNILNQNLELQQQQITEHEQIELYQLKDLITALAVCHNVMPTYNEDDEKIYQASSPDEIALVTIAEDLGIELINREQHSMQIQNSQDFVDKFQILDVFPFSSETKRMGIIVRHEHTNQIIFYLKGADIVMKKLLPNDFQIIVDKYCEQLAKEGLRTLVIAQKLLSQEEYDQWKKDYKKAEASLENRKIRVNQVLGELEKNVMYLGITGVEDKLQEDCQIILSDMRKAGIQIWMLTGDKMETAICISVSSGLKDPRHQIYQIKEISSKAEIQTKLNQYKHLAQNHVLVIDGNSLKYVLQTEFTEDFFKYATQAPTVVCCRCSPTQKALITKYVKKYTKKVVCSMGDGGNDVGMIQEADVGIGIMGKEGQQAALSADFSVQKLNSIKKLILWHGRNSYKRSALLSQFVLHRGLIISIMQFVFICCFYFVSLQVFDSALLLGYSTIFTMLPVFCLVFDEDISEEIAMNYPQIYKSLQQGRNLNTKTFLEWFSRALYTGTTIQVMILVCIKDSFLLIQSIGFSILIFIEYLMTISELSKLNWISFLCSFLSLVVYLLVWLVFPDFFHLVTLNNYNQFFYTILIGTTAYLPIICIQIIRKFLWPTDYEQIIKQSKSNNSRVNVNKKAQKQSLISLSEQSEFLDDTNCLNTQKSYQQQSTCQERCRAVYYTNRCERKLSCVYELSNFQECINSDKHENCDKMNQKLEDLLNSNDFNALDQLDSDYGSFYLSCYGDCINDEANTSLSKTYLECLKSCFSQNLFFNLAILAILNIFIFFM
ncbi:P-type ATPase, cytoplasmic domain N [Pseudocohnilembus persalinus]|uniref:Phospholipid-transporting ATPase n=1 Tax=Pseudocohnilembus persalinus TaxID=266149 RepID=A0A0V0QNV9_PSEPJ|nr:P-type ATPase, cytoplasmic domain N [Pseudocohnilembus persalinus]|eukprot:KRX03653.1 P-type ATPase, cytoplasmic domain N [Pseudocohnilembus persalinus]